MKFHLRAFTAVAVWTVILYLTGTIGNWDLDPGMWTRDSRVGIAMGWMVGAAIRLFLVEDFEMPAQQR